MNYAQALSLTRWAVAVIAGGAIGAWLKSMGFALDSAAIEVFAGFLAAIVMAVWSFFTHTKTATVERAKDMVATTENATLIKVPDAGPKLYDFGIILIIGLIALAVGGAALAPRLAAKLPITRESILQGERTYALVLVGVKNYEGACKARAIPASCDAIVVVMKADVVQTNTIYQVVKGYEDMPPDDIGHAFLAAVAVVKAALPLAYIPQGA